MDWKFIAVLVALAAILFYDGVRIRKLEDSVHRTYNPGDFAIAHYDIINTDFGDFAHSNLFEITSASKDYIILLRHGESEANIDPSKYGPVNASDAHQLGYGDPNVRLSALGIRQVR